MDLFAKYHQNQLVIEAKQAIEAGVYSMGGDITPLKLALGF